MSANTQLRVLVLAGGMGTRLASRLQGLPKLLAPIASKPFLDWMLVWLNSTLYPLRFEVSLCTGHLASTVELYCKNCHPGVNIISEDSQLGTFGAIVNALNSSTEENLLIINGDTVFEADLAQAFSHFLTEPDSPLLVVRNQDDASRYQAYSLETDSNQLILNDHGEYISMGAFFVSRTALLRSHTPLILPSSVDSSFLSQVRVRPFTLPSCSFFIDIGVPDCYERAQTVIPQFIDNLLATQ